MSGSVSLRAVHPMIAKRRSDTAAKAVARHALKGTRKAIRNQGKGFNKKLALRNTQNRHTKKMSAIAGF